LVEGHLRHEGNSRLGDQPRSRGRRRAFASAALVAIALVPVGLALFDERGEAQTATGTIIIEKQTDPDGASGGFTFTAERLTSGNFGMADGGTRTFTNVAPGTYNVREADPGPNFEVGSIVCTDANSTGNLETRTAVVRLEPGESVRCVFTNRDRRGRIIIEKQTDPDGASGGFTFTAERLTSGNVSLADNGVATWLNVVPGTYNVRERDPGPTFGLTSINCDDANSTGNLETRTAVVRLDPGETVRCVFTNTLGAAPPSSTGDAGTIVIEKQTDVQGDTTSFSFQGAGIPGDGNGVYLLSDDGTRSFTVPPGTYAASEWDPAPNYRVSNIRCSDSDSTGDIETRTATIRVSAGETVRCVFENTDVRGQIIIEKQTDVQGDTTSFSFQGAGIPGDGNGVYLLSDDGTRSFTVPPGTYAASEWDPGPAYGLAGLTCDDGDSTTDLDTRTATIRVQPKETVRCVFRNEGVAQVGTIVVEKLTTPTTATETFAFTGAASGSIGNAGTIAVADLPVGTYTSTEMMLAGWDLTSIRCNDSDSTGNTSTRTATFRLAVGETVTCTFTNTRRGAVTVKKTTNRVIDPSKDIRFVLTGPGLPSGGISRSTFGDQDAVLEFGSGNLVPGQTYTICEMPVPAGFTSFWKLDGAIVVPYNPDASKTPPEDLGTRCYGFSVSPGQTRAFEVDNSRPGGEPRTIGYWKNWNRCTGGNQSATAQRNGGAAAGFFLVEDLLPQTIGDFSVTSCQQAVNLLAKRDGSGRSKSSDAAYELGAQLLAARLNLAAGAETCSAVQQAVLDGQTLLDTINFSGSGDYLGSKSKDPNRAQALSRASTLDRYNNGGLC
jgi:Prealbumin-like fold domain